MPPGPQASPAPDASASLRGVVNTVTQTFSGTKLFPDGIGFGALTDSVGTPGNATINATKGRSSVANGQSVLVITNSVVTANTVVHVIWEQIPRNSTIALVWEVTSAPGSFTVTIKDPSFDSAMPVDSNTICRWYLVG